jgi:hypothetical protein
MSTQAPTQPTKVDPGAVAQARPRRTRQKFPVFNPSDWPDDVQAGGRMYHFAPLGVTLIEDMLEWPRNEQGELLKHMPRVIPERGDAETIAELIVSGEVRGDKGFVILDGTPDTWEAQKALARETWVAQHERTVESAIASWEAKVASYNSQGLPLPSQSKAVVLAYAWRKRHRAGLTRNPELLCQVCSHYTLSREELAQHIREEHPQLAASVMGPAAAQVEREQAQSLVPPAAPPAVSRGRGRQPAPIKTTAAAPVESQETDEERLEREAMEAENKAPANVEAALGNLASAMPPTKAEKELVGRELAARAKTVGLELTVADKKGLTNGDGDVIEDVARRVTVAVDRKARETKK